MTSQNEVPRCPRCEEPITISPVAGNISRHRDRCGLACWANGKNIDVVQSAIRREREQLGLTA